MTCLGLLFIVRSDERIASLGQLCIGLVWIDFWGSLVLSFIAPWLLPVEAALASFALSLFGLFSLHFGAWLLYRVSLHYASEKERGGSGPPGHINVTATAASARLGTPNARLAERPYRYGRFILLRVMRRTQSSAAAIWAGVACGLITGVCAPSSHSCGHTLRFLARTP